MQQPGEDKRADMLKCDAARGRIAPTWVHYDVRCYEPKYLGDEMFCTTLEALDDRKPIRV